jgi:hypothetical protein
MGAGVERPDAVAALQEITAETSGYKDSADMKRAIARICKHDGLGGTLGSDRLGCKA